MKYGKWCLLFLKRLYHKPVFLVLLLLIPLLTFGYSSLSREDSGILTVAVAQQDPDDALATRLIADLCQSSQLIRFDLCESPDQARELVTYGKADSAWIFDADLENRIAAFVAKPERRNAFVEVIEREESMFLTLTREKLSGFVFTYLSPEFYLQYVRNNLPQLSDKTDAELMAHYDAVSLSDDLFTYAARESAPKEQNYLLTPVRGLLAIVTMLCGMAAAMFYVFSQKAGEHYNALERTYVMFAIGSVTYVIAALVQCAGHYDTMIVPAVTSIEFWGGMIYLSVFSSVAAFMALNFGSSYIPVSQASIFANLTTVISIVAGVVVLHEAFTLPQVIGAALILVSVYVASVTGQSQQKSKSE